MKLKPVNIITGEKSPVLRAVAPVIQNFDKALGDLVAAMAAAMREAKGIGLAAPQVGKSSQLFLIDKAAFSLKESSFKFLKGENIVVSEFLAVANPKLAIRPSGFGLAEEGCLSLPSQVGYVSRAKKLVLSGQTMSGQTFKLQAKGLLARVIQHEYDHLQGILICDKIQSV